MDGKYPKIPGSADPDPKRTFGKRSKFVRRGRELGAVPSSARCRSHLSNSRFPSFPPRASRAPCLFGSIWLGSPLQCITSVHHIPYGPPHVAARCRARRPGAPRRYNNAPSSVIAYGDATFPPERGRLLGCVLQASPLRGKLLSECETDEGADENIRPYES